MIDNSNRHQCGWREVLRSARHEAPSPPSPMTTLDDGISKGGFANRRIKDIERKESGK
jgi:hypothetical protein